jgi:Protein of unknown function (DUF3386)
MTQTALASEADELLHGAYTSNYRFPPGFAGFRSDLRYRSDGVAASGSVLVPAGSAPQLELNLPEDELRRLRHELGSLAAHRFHRDYESADGAHAKQLEDDENALGRLVTIEDAMASSYRVGNGSINQITRTHGGSRFTIVIQGRVTAPDGRRASAAFTVFHWAEEDGRLVRTDAYEDGYAEVAGLLLPARRRVATASDAGLAVREIVLERHELLDPEGVR